MNIQEAIAVFDAAEAETLAVVETVGDRRPIGFSARPMRCGVMRESEQRRREVSGEHDGGRRES